MLTNYTCQGQCQILNITFSHRILTPVLLGGNCCRQQGFPGGASGREPTCQFRRHRRHGFDPWVGKIPWRRPWQPTPVFLPGEPHGQRILADFSPWGAECHTCLRRFSMHTRCRQRCTGEKIGSERCNRQCVTWQRQGKLSSKSRTT